jgi:PKHD-type hydroxylase
VLQQIVQRVLKRNPVFQMAARPLRIAPPLFSRYEPGMEYGTHVDDAVMSGGDAPVRTDIAFTLFLSDPASYQGGELVVETTGGEQIYKLEAGSMIVYPASTLHRVAPVTEGVRLACVSWIQSQVRDPHRRELLFDLDTARRTLFEREGKTAEFDLISKSVANLLRMWAEV